MADTKANEIMLSMRDIHKSFGALGVLRGIDLSLARGEVLAIIGSSGSGKSTLLRCINRLETIDRGDITIGGEVLHTMRDLAAEHMTMIVVTHEMAFAREAATNVVFMENGVIVEQGEPQTFFSAPKEERTQEFLRNML